ncbi:N-acyl homoserine lactonase family protein [Ruicaihuangia caeni]|uniref:N-acyl homoserine lactonase family protein n=1 Tax=Ruicaihuangia caeni TaxID=3042517 RepID=UPI00338DC92F
MTRTADRLFVVQFGAERVSKNLSLAGGPHHLYWEPLYGVIVETGEGRVLFDTGMSRASHHSAENTAAYRAGGVGASNLDVPWHLYPEPPRTDDWNWGLPGDPLVAGLAQVGLEPSDISLAVISHMHVDHSGGIGTLTAAGVPIAIQRRELEFVQSGAVGIAEGFNALDWTAPGTQWRVIDGDEELAPGVRAVSTPGHTPGHQSLLVDLPESGSWLFAGDAADLAQNFLDHTPCGSCAGGTDEDAQNAAESIDRLLALARERQARLIPGHDQVVVNAVRHPRGGHR